ncbi:MAG: hypothetical protein M3Q14_04555 [bacterium]|nr:hypothetical protein [bacterium]
MSESNITPSFSPEELARIAEAELKGREEAKRLLGEQAAESFFDYMDAKRAGTPPTR